MSEKKNIRLTVYDFDKTIYKGETSTNFYIYLIKKNPLFLLFFPLQAIFIFLYCIKLIKLENLKENFFIFLNFISQKKLEFYVEEFWKKEKSKINEWFYEEFNKLKKEGDFMVCISASPDFLLEDFIKKLGFDLVITSKFLRKDDKVIPKLIGKNCKKDEKVKRLNNWADENNFNYQIRNFYSDSLSDKPLYDLAEKKFLVENGILSEGLPSKKTIIDKIFWK